ncbi:GtrA family protein [Corynebacterium sp. sy017]|nr:GtrA family protein [Corynebacterium sp. sy017]MBP3088344.1 GtrA family protein [Corynebacterium sp. sy017]QDZ43451.1 GtrA family protein [Corynebacterium sp. sy039]TSD92079.1 GtrA family protein [Corynebacterium sp. SY003]
MIRFLVVGIFSAVIDFGLTIILRNVGLSRPLAKTCGWVAGTITAYFINTKWTFNAQTSKKSGAAVALLYLTTFLVQLGLFQLLEAPLYALGLTKFWVDAIAFVIAQGVATAVNFVVQRLVVFKEPAAQEDSGA